MTRNRLILVLGVIVAGALGLWLGPRLHRGAQAGPLPDLLQLAPPDSTTVLYADLSSLRSTPWIEKLAAAIPPVNTDKDYAEFVRGTGFAFERDLDHMVLAVRPGAGPVGQTLVIADGRFDRQKISEYALKTGKLENRGGRSIYVIPSATPGKTVSIAFLEGGRIALSDGGDLPALLAASGSGAPAMNAAVQDRLSRVAGSPLFSVVKVPATAPGQPAAPGTPFQFLRWISFAAKPDGEQLLISAEGECDDPDQAQKLAGGLELFRTIIRGGLSDPKGRGQMSAQEAASLSGLLKDITISSSESRVRLLLHVSPDTLNALASLAPGKQAAPAPPVVRKK